MKYLNKLITLGTPTLCSTEMKLSAELLALAGSLAQELLSLLQRKNGFYAFESALHVFPSESVGNEIGLKLWNSHTLWRNAYTEQALNCLFFAEDIFGSQFCIKEKMIATFDPETGKTEWIAGNMNEWAKIILTDYSVLTGYPLAHEWQKINGPIPSGMRLIPKVPFVLGGEFNLSNLYALESVKAMRLRSEISLQIKDCPDGAYIGYRSK